MKIDIEVVENGVIVSYRDLISTKTEVFELDDYEKIEKLLKSLYQKVYPEYQIGEYVRILNSKGRGLDANIDLIRHQAYTEGFEDGWSKSKNLLSAKAVNDMDTLSYLIEQNDQYLAYLKDELHEMITKTLERGNQ